MAALKFYSVWMYELDGYQEREDYSQRGMPLAFALCDSAYEAKAIVNDSGLWERVLEEYMAGDDTIVGIEPVVMESVRMYERDLLAAIDDYMFEHSDDMVAEELKDTPAEFFSALGRGLLLVDFAEFVDNYMNWSYFCASIYYSKQY